MHPHSSLFSGMLAAPVCRSRATACFCLLSPAAIGAFPSRHAPPSSLAMFPFFSAAFGCPLSTHHLLQALLLLFPLATFHLFVSRFRFPIPLRIPASDSPRFLGDGPLTTSGALLSSAHRLLSRHAVVLSRAGRFQCTFCGFGLYFWGAAPLPPSHLFFPRVSPYHRSVPGDLLAP